MGREWDQTWNMDGHLEIRDLCLGRSLQGHRGELETCSFPGSEPRRRATGCQCEFSQPRQALSSPSPEVNKQSQRATLEWEKASDWGLDLETVKVPSSPESL